MQQLDNFMQSALLAFGMPASLAIIMLGICASVVLFGGIDPAAPELDAGSCIAVMLIGALVETGARIGASMRGGAALVVLVSMFTVCVSTLVDVAAFVDEGGAGAVSGAQALSVQARITAILCVMTAP